MSAVTPASIVLAQPTISAPQAPAALPGSCAAGSCLPGASIPWFRLIVGLFIAMQTMTFSLATNLTPPDDDATRLLLQGGMLAGTLLVLGLLGWPLATEAARQVFSRRVTMELLFLAGISAAFAISCRSMLAGGGQPVYFEVVSELLVVYSIGGAISAHSRGRALAAMRGLGRSVSLARRAADGQMIDSAGLVPGDLVRVMPGELIPIDGAIVEGTALVRQTPFTGEWISAVRRPGDAVLAGTACEDATLLVRATSPGSTRRLDRLAQLIDQAGASPTKLQRQADRFVRWFLPVVLLTSTGTLLAWGILTGRWQAALFNGLAVLLVACPCAAGLATPLAIWSAIGRLAQRGLLLRSGDAIERLAEVDAVIFDKTGTLADERLVLKDLTTSEDPTERHRILSLVGAIERHLDHPVANLLRDVAPPEPLPVEVRSVRILPGQGIEAECSAGAPPTIHQVRIVREEAVSASADLTLSVTIDGRWAATATIAEALRDSARAAVAELAAMDLPVTVLTGDGLAGAAAASRLAPTTACLTPEQKHDLVRSSSRSRQLFVGDGLNDAAAMAAAHVSIALAGGSAIAIETASATLSGGNLTLVPHAIATARRATATIRSNLRWAMAYNVLGMAFAAAGWLHPVLAVVLMALSSAMVSWRSLNGSDETVGDRARRPKPAPSAPVQSQRSTVRASVHTVALLAQGILLTCLADLAWPVALLCLGAFGGVAWAFTRARRLPAWADMILAMLSVGGLGMTLGWWADVGFGSATHQGLMGSCCAPSALHTSHWMFVGMLAFGLPAMYLLPGGRPRFDWRRWCCVGPLLVGTPAMVLGMWAGSMLSATVTWPTPALGILADWAAMTLGMAAGMLLAHLPELLFGEA